MEKSQPNIHGNRRSYGATMGGKVKNSWIIERVGANPPSYLTIVVRGVGGRGLAWTHVIADALAFETQEQAQARIDVLADIGWYIDDLQPVLWKQEVKRNVSHINRVSRMLRTVVCHRPRKARARPESVRPAPHRDAPRGESVLYDQRRILTAQRTKRESHMSKFEGIADPVAMGFEIDLQNKRYVTTEGLFVLDGRSIQKVFCAP